MTKPSQVADGIIAFADAELLPALGGWQMWAASAALALMRQRIDVVAGLLAQNPTVQLLGLMDADGMIDVDTAITALKATAKSHGKLEITVPGAGKYALGEEDFDALGKYIAQAGAREG